MQKCSGRNCIHKERCLHYAESLKKNFVKGKWIRTELCIEPLRSDDESKLLSPSYSELALEEG